MCSLRDVERQVAHHGGGVAGRAGCAANGLGVLALKTRRGTHLGTTCRRAPTAVPTAQTITTAAVVREEPLPEPPSTSFDVEVTAVHARLRVAGVGPPLLLLHGLGCSSRYFQPLQRLLATDFTVYSPDLPGHGHSEKPVDRLWQLRALTEWVAAFITTLDLERPVLVGHSLGGGLAVELAARYPQLVHGLVLLAPTGVPNMPPLLGQLPRLLLDGALEPRRLFPLIVPAYLQAGVRRMLRLAIDQTRHPRRAALRRIRLPMLVLRGSRDPIVTRAAMVELAREASAAQLREIRERPMPSTSATRARSGAPSLRMPRTMCPPKAALDAWLEVTRVDHHPLPTPAADRVGFNHGLAAALQGDPQRGSVGAGVPAASFVGYGRQRGRSRA